MDTKFLPNKKVSNDNLPTDDCANINGKNKNLNSTKWLRQRELNLFPTRSNYSSETEMKNILYGKIQDVGRIPCDDNVGYRPGHGGIFGIDFSPDGAIIAAACENECLFLMDPLTRKSIKTVENVHTDCVNSVKFLDSRLFATCSDDHTVKLWDLRFIKQQQQPIRTLRGHTSWVKNMEYMPNEGILLTSGFDHYVYSWEINRYQENQAEEFTRVFYTPGLIRMCITPDHSKMIISTQWGYLFVVHNFDIETCAVDLAGFKPNVCYLMLKSDNRIGVTTTELSRKMHHRRFYAAKNRAELIVDFPTDNDPENITSITPHPYGWCVLSRNTNSSENGEWTCVHDIQSPSVDELLENENEDAQFSDTSSSFTAEAPTDDFPSTSSYDSGQSTNNEGDIDRRVTSVENRFAQISDYYRQRPLPRARPTARMSTGGGRTVNHTSPARYAVNWGLVSLANRNPNRDGNNSNDNFVPKTNRRLTHYIEEANVGRGFIKVQSLNADGKLIASPFGFGVRLLAFDDKYSELSQVSPLKDLETGLWSNQKSSKKKEEIVRTYDLRSRIGAGGGVASKVNQKKRRGKTPKKKEYEPIKLHEVNMHVAHTSPVLCAQFSPTHCLLVTGCLHGKVAFYQPVL